MDAGRIGLVGEIYRYPVKSMLGEILPLASVSERGIDGDRRLAVLDRETGRIVSAKNPGLWAGMLQHRAELAPDGVSIILPDGERVRADLACAGEMLSQSLGREVSVISDAQPDMEIERADPAEVLEKGAGSRVTVTMTRIGAGSPPGTFFDFAPLHLISSATMEEIGREAGHSIDAFRYRPNLVVRTEPTFPAFGENDWPGRRLAIGPRVVIQVIVPTPRCAIPGLRHGQAAPDLQASLAVTRRNKVQVLDLGKLPCLGVYARILSGGDVATGDELRLLAD